MLREILVHARDMLATAEIAVDPDWLDKLLHERLLHKPPASPLDRF